MTVERRKYSNSEETYFQCTKCDFWVKKEPDDHYGRYKEDENPRMAMAIHELAHALDGFSTTVEFDATLPIDRILGKLTDEIERLRKAMEEPIIIKGDSEHLDIDKAIHKKQEGDLE